MHYIAVEYYPGGYVAHGEGVTEQDALADLNKTLSGFPHENKPFVPYQNVQDITEGYANRGQPSSYIITNSIGMLDEFLADFDL